MVNEQALKQELKALMSKYNIRGHLVLFLEGEKVNFVGDLDVPALTPILLKSIIRIGGS